RPVEEFDRVRTCRARLARRSLCRGFPYRARYQINTPTTAAVVHVANVALTRLRKPSRVISARRDGAMVASPAIRMPTLPKFAKPQSAYVASIRVRSLTAPGG